MRKPPYVAIVDDERALVNVLRKGFTNHGIPVVFVAFDGDEAVHLFEKAEIKPDVIVMDYSMPRLDGVEAARQILAIAPGVKIIFLSGYRLDGQKAAEGGAVAFISKPASIRAVIEAVYKAG